jgi:hypothetical protein
VLLLRELQGIDRMEAKKTPARFLQGTLSLSHHRQATDIGITLPLKPQVHPIPGNHFKFTAVCPLPAAKRNQHATTRIVPPEQKTDFSSYFQQIT